MKPKNRVIAEYAFVSALCLLASIAEATRLNSLQTQNAETPLLTFNGKQTMDTVSLLLSRTAQ